MIVYHSSDVSVEKPDVKFSRDYLDFGKGFYVTTLREQAVKYGQRFKRRQKNAWISTYEFDYEPSEWKILQFDSYSREWLQFVATCREGKDETDYDMVIGGIANDKVVQALDRYFAGELSENETLGLLRYEKPNNQLCIRSQRMLDECLKHKGSEQL